MIEIFCKVDFELTLGMKYKDLIETVKHLNEVLNNQPELKTAFFIDKKEYGFIPNLDDITLGEYVDLDNYLGNWETMNKAMSVLYRPITIKKGDRYLIEEYKGSKYSEVMKESPVSVCIGAMVFFLQFKQRVVKSYPELFEEGVREQSNLGAIGSFGKKMGMVSVNLCTRWRKY